MALFLDEPVVGELAQHALELDAVGVLQAELARNFAGSDLSGICLDEGDDGCPVGKATVILAFHLTSIWCRHFSWPELWRQLPWSATFWPTTTRRRAPCWWIRIWVCPASSASCRRPWPRARRSARSPAAA